MRGRYKRPLASRDFIGLWKEKRYRRNMMFLCAGHSAGLLSKNFVKQSFTKFLESQLHGSRRKSYLSAPFFFHLRYGWLVRGRLYMPGQRYELHHKICNLRYGTPGYGMSAYKGRWRQNAVILDVLWFANHKRAHLPEFHLWFLPLVTWIDGFHRLKSLHAAQSWINKK